MKPVKITVKVDKLNDTGNIDLQGRLLININ